MNGTETRKTVVIALPNASPTRSRSAGGSAKICAALCSWEASMPDAAGIWWSLSASRLATTAPPTAVPNEPPIDRRKVTVLVAEPRWRRSTAFCTASTVTCMTMPMPTPSTSM